MAIEAGHIYNRELLMNQKQLGVGGQSIFHETIPMPDAGMPTEATFQTPLYLSAAESGLTCNNDRKRSREYYSAHNDDSFGMYSLLELEAAAQIHDQQRELDCLVAIHTQRLKAELEERAERRSKVLETAVSVAVESKMREKDEEIKRLSKLNWALQERVRSLCVENHLWRGIAQSNEAAANSLRTDLERVLTVPGIVEK